MWKCDRCKEYKYDMVKVCNCQLFEIIDEEGDEYEVYAIDEEDAALKYAETSNCENGNYLMDDSVDITVNGKKFRISAEADIRYDADELD